MKMSVDASEVSVIVAAYNNFPWLRLCLEGLRHQTAKGFEIVIADDGSSQQTVQQLRSYIHSHPQMRIRHVWHADNGWRKNMALNNAVLASTGSYLLFIDADCVPSPDWVADHLRLSRPDTIIAGRRTTLSPELNERLENSENLTPRWWRGIVLHVITRFWRFPKRSRQGRVIKLPIISGHGLLERPTGNLIGCNMGISKDNLLALNGFDERYLDAGIGEDIDLLTRHCARGGKVVKVPHQARMVHRLHPTNIGSSRRSDNMALLEQTRTDKVVATPYGIKKQHPPKV